VRRGSAIRSEEHTSRLEPNNQILAATLDGLHAFTFQARCDGLWIERARQARVGDLDVLEAPPFE